MILIILPHMTQCCVWSISKVLSSLYSIVSVASWSSEIIFYFQKGQIDSVYIKLLFPWCFFLLLSPASTDPENMILLSNSLQKILDFCFIAGIPDQSGIRSLSWKVSHCLIFPFTLMYNPSKDARLTLLLHVPYLMRLEN